MEKEKKGPSRQRAQGVRSPKGEGSPEGDVILCQSMGCPRDAGNQGWMLYRDWSQTWVRVGWLYRTLMSIDW